MVFLFRRYAHVPLAIVSVFLIALVIAWLLERRVDGVRDPAPRIGAPVQTVLTITPALPAPAEDSEAAAVEAEPAAPEPPGESVATTSRPAPDAIPVAPSAPAAPADRYVLEMGPFLSAELADRTEDQLHQLGYATVRFRKQEVRRVYHVMLTGFVSAAEAQRAVDELGRGAVVAGEERPAVLVERHATLHDAIAAARALRGRGGAPRVSESVGPTVIYHVRYGRFGSQALAEARGEELAALGFSSQVVKLR